MLKYIILIKVLLYVLGDYGTWYAIGVFAYNLFILALVLNVMRVNMKLILVLSK